MTAIRTCGLLGGFAMIVLVVVYLRVEQTRCASRTLALESQWIALRRELWSAEAHTARLRAPGQVHDRLEWFETDLTGPASRDLATPGVRIVLARTSE